MKSIDETFIADPIRKRLSESEGQGEEVISKCFHGFDVTPIAPKFVFHEKLGGGMAGYVNSEKCKLCQFKIAVKAVKLYEDCPSRRNVAAEIERRNLLYLKNYGYHENIIKFYGCIDSKIERFFYFELGDTTLRNYLDVNIERLSISHFNEISYQQFSILEFLDKVKLFHGDFYDDNMVVCFSEGVIKLIDFHKSKKPEDLCYKDPLEDLKVSSLALAKLQLWMRYKSKKNRSSYLAISYFQHYRDEIIFTNSGKEIDCTAEFILSRQDNWLPDLQVATRELIVKGLSHNRQIQREAIAEYKKIHPREKLTRILNT